MTIQHHLDDALLMAYAAGSLPEAFGVVVATHIALCDECRARAASFDSVGGALMEQDDDAAQPMGDGALAATLALIDAAPMQDQIRPPIRRDTVFPEPLWSYVGGDLDAVRWRSVGGGVAQAILPTARGATARLLRIPGGVAVPDHGHRGTELTLVLQGSFADETDRFGPGDIEIADQDLTHTPVADPGPDCICLAATDAPLRFKSLLPRLAQPFLRI